MKNIVAGILAHVDSGKTTLSEALLYQSGALRRLGRVDHQDAFLDTDAMERERGITIFSKQAVFTLEDTEVTLLDTPGHVDFSAEASRKLADIQKRDDANELGLCMVKTHLSLSDDPGVKGAPKGWKLRIRDVLTFGGAGFVVPVSGSITLMPGTGSNPSFRRVDVDVDTGRVKGIF